MEDLYAFLGNGNCIGDGKSSKKLEGSKMISSGF